MKKIVALLVVAVMCAGCIQGVRAGKRCNTTDWGDDGTYALKCENGRWVRKATKAQVAALLIAVAKARQAATTTTTTTTPPTPPLLSVSPDGQISLRGGGVAVAVDGGGNGWYGLVFGTPSEGVAVLAHLSSGANPTILSAQRVVPAPNSVNRAIPTDDGSRVAMISNDHYLFGWAPTGSAYVPTWPNTSTVTTVTCLSPTHIVTNGIWPYADGSLDQTPFAATGHSNLSSQGCSSNGRFVSLLEPASGFFFTNDEGAVYDSSNGTYSTVVSAGPGDHVMLGSPSDDGAYVGVSTGSTAGIWNRGTGSIAAVAGYQAGDVPLYVGAGGGRSIWLRNNGVHLGQMVQYGPNGPALLDSEVFFRSDVAFNPDLMSGIRRYTDGTFRIISPDWSGPG